MGLTVLLTLGTLYWYQVSSLVLKWHSRTLSSSFHVRQPSCRVARVAFHSIGVVHTCTGHEAHVGDGSCGPAAQFALHACQRSPGKAESAHEEPCSGRQVPLTGKVFAENSFPFA